MLTATGPWTPVVLGKLVRRASCPEEGLHGRHCKTLSCSKWNEHRKTLQFGLNQFLDFSRSLQIFLIHGEWMQICLIIIIFNYIYLYLQLSLCFVEITFLQKYVLIFKFIYNFYNNLFYHCILNILYNYLIKLFQIIKFQKNNIDRFHSIFLTHEPLLMLPSR